MLTFLGVAVGSFWPFKKSLQIWERPPSTGDFPYAKTCQTTRQILSGSLQIDLACSRTVVQLVGA